MCNCEKTDICILFIFILGHEKLIICFQFSSWSFFADQIVQSSYSDSQKFIIFVTSKSFYISFDVVIICINCVFPFNSMYCNGICSVAYQKKPGYQINLGELVGPDTYNLLCVALSYTTCRYLVSFNYLHHVLVELNANLLSHFNIMQYHYGQGVNQCDDVY